ADDAAHDPEQAPRNPAAGCRWAWPLGRHRRGGGGPQPTAHGLQPRQALVEWRDEAVEAGAHEALRVVAALVQRVLVVALGGDALPRLAPGGRPPRPPAVP